MYLQIRRDFIIDSPVFPSYEYGTHFEGELEFTPMTVTRAVEDGVIRSTNDETSGTSAGSTSSFAA